MALVATLAVPASATSLTGITVGASGARIALDGTPSYRAFRLSAPDRYVVDLRDTELGVAERSWPGACPIRGVRAAPFALGSGVTRVVFDLDVPLEAGTRDAAGGLLVEFRVPADPREPEPAAETEEPAESASPDFKDALAPLAIPAAAGVLSPSMRLPNIQLSSRLVAFEAGPERVDLTVTGPFEPAIFLLSSPARLVIDLPGVAGGAFPAARPAPGGTVRAARSGGRARAARVVLDLAHAAPYSVRTAGDVLSILFEPAPSDPPVSRTREFKGWLVDGSGRPLDGVFLVRFSLPEDGVLEGSRWVESTYVDARGGRFTAVLGREHPLPTGALSPGVPLDAAAPPGVAWRVVPR